MPGRWAAPKPSPHCLLREGIGAEISHAPGRFCGPVTGIRFYTFEDERPRFHGGSVPAQSELQRLLHAIVTRSLEKQGLLLRDAEPPSLDLEPADGFEQLLGAAVHYRIAVGPRAGRKALTLHTVATNAPTHPPASLSSRDSPSIAPRMV